MCVYPWVYHHCHYMESAKFWGQFRYSQANFYQPYLTWPSILIQENLSPCCSIQARNTGGSILSGTLFFFPGTPLEINEHLNSLASRALDAPYLTCKSLSFLLQWKQWWFSFMALLFLNNSSCFVCTHYVCKFQHVWIYFLTNHIFFS